MNFLLNESLYKTCVCWTKTINCWTRCWTRTEYCWTNCWTYTPCWTICRTNCWTKYFVAQICSELFKKLLHNILPREGGNTYAIMSPEWLHYEPTPPNIFLAGGKQYNLWSTFFEYDRLGACGTTNKGDERMGPPARGWPRWITKSISMKILWRIICANENYNISDAKP